jgi:hypothetical protein
VQQVLLATGRDADVRANGYLHAKHVAVQQLEQKGLRSLLTEQEKQLLCQTLAAEGAAARSRVVDGTQSMQECNICGVCLNNEGGLCKQETREESGLLKFRVRLGDGMKIRAVTFIPNGQTGDDSVTALMTACDQGFLYQWRYCHPKTGGPCCTSTTAVDAGKGVFELLKVFHSGKNTALNKCAQTQPEINHSHSP